MELDSAMKRQIKSAVKMSSGVGAMGLLTHLRDILNDKALGHAEKELASKTDIRFDTIAIEAQNAVRKAYLAILDDPKALEAIKKELARGTDS